MIDGLGTTLGRGLRAFRRGGLPEVVRRIRARRRREPEYQDKLRASFEARWRIIREAIPAGSASLLDVGSNLGAFTAQAAKEGFWTVGIEKSESLIRRARRSYAGVSRCAYMRAEIDFEMCSSIPEFDVVLLLSVHHHWHHAFGPEIAAQMLARIVSRSKNVTFFEGASRDTRFESNFPDFVDNDETSITGYYQSYLDGAVGHLSS